MTPTPFSERAIALAIEDWLHKVMDAEYRPTPRATMRWQWCKRPHHSEDDDCAACLRTSEDALQEAEEGCGCICHKRTKSLAAFLNKALKGDYARLLEVERMARAVLDIKVNSIPIADAECMCCGDLLCAFHALRRLVGG